MKHSVEKALGSQLRNENNYFLLHIVHIETLPLKSTRPQPKPELASIQPTKALQPVHLRALVFRPLGVVLKTRQDKQICHDENVYFVQGVSKFTTSLERRIFLLRPHIALRLSAVVG